MKKKLLVILALLSLVTTYNVSAEEKNGFYEENNNTYYYVDGVIQKGITQIGEDYYFLGENTGRVVIGWVTSIIDGKKYYSNSEGILQKGFQTISGTTYYFGEDYSLQKGVKQIGENYYFLGENTGRVVIGWVTSIIDGKKYYSNSEGILQKGFQTISGTTYYFGEDYSLQKGVKQIGENYYFLGENTGRVVKGLVTSIIDGKKYYANSEGILQKGFQTIGGTTYYFGEDYSLQKGVKQIGENYYFLGENTGRVVIGWVTSIIDGKKYYSNSEGILQKGFQTIGGTTYYFGEDYSLQKGVKQIGEDYYFLGENTGRVVIGWVTSIIDGKKYYSDSEGILQKGFQTINGTTYYFGEDYSLQKGIKQIGEDFYFLGENTGRVVIGWVTSIINGKIYYANQEGKLLKGDQIIDGNSYRFSEDYSLETGWQTIDGYSYYFYRDGTKARFICKIAGTRYEFDANGRLQYSNIKQIADVSAHNGTIDWDTLWNSGEIDGVILRIAAGAINEDFMLKEYIRNVQRLNIPYGVYIYSYAENYDEGRIYADFTNFTMNRYNMNPTLGVYLDLESNAITSYMTPQLYEGVVRGFIDVLPFSKVYTYTNYANTALNSPYIHQFIDWIANYSVTDRPGNYNKWQYTSKGKLPGINGNVDLSIFYN